MDCSRPFPDVWPLPKRSAACRDPCVVLPFPTGRLCYLFHKKTKFSNAFALEEEMHTSAVSGNTWSKVVFGLTAVLLVFAPPTARPGEVAEATTLRNPLDLT